MFVPCQFLRLLVAGDTRRQMKRRLLQQIWGEEERVVTLKILDDSPNPPDVRFRSSCLDYKLFVVVFISVRFVRVPGGGLLGWRQSINILCRVRPGPV